jgi:hypothetical protein
VERRFKESGEVGVGSYVPALIQRVREAEADNVRLHLTEARLRALDVTASARIAQLERVHELAQEMVGARRLPDIQFLQGRMTAALAALESAQ